MEGFITRGNLSTLEVKQICISFNVGKVKPDGETKIKAEPKSMKVGESCEISNIFLWRKGGHFSDIFQGADLEGGSLFIQVDFKLFRLKRATLSMDLNEQLKSFEKREMQKLSKSMTQMLLNQNKVQEMGKIKVVAKDLVEIYVNAAILVARSPVFKVMFSSGNWKEGQCSEEGETSLLLEDLSGKTVKVLLHYLYGGTLLEEDWKAQDVILELTWAADKYQLEGLSEFLDTILPELPLQSTELMGKLALLTKLLRMKNAESGLLRRLKKEAVDIDQLLLNKDDALLAEQTKVENQTCRTWYCSIM